MITVQETVRCAAPPERVWPLMADFSNTAVWDPGVVRSTRNAVGALREGDTYTVWVKMGLLSVPMRYRTLVLQEPHRVVLQGVGGVIRALDDIQVAPGPHGGSEVTWKADLSLRGPLAVFEPLMGTAFQQVADEAMLGLRQWLGNLTL